MRQPAIVRLRRAGGCDAATLNTHSSTSAPSVVHAITPGPRAAAMKIATPSAGPVTTK